MSSVITSSNHPVSLLSSSNDAHAVKVASFEDQGSSSGRNHQNKLHIYGVSLKQVLNKEAYTDLSDKDSTSPEPSTSSYSGPKSQRSLRFQIYCCFEKHYSRSGLVELITAFRNFCIDNKPIIEEQTHMSEFSISCKCGGTMLDPISLPCGHTLCKACIEENMFCIECGCTYEFTCKINLFLAEIFEKWFPQEYGSARLKKLAGQLLKDGLNEKALSEVDKALSLTPNDFQCFNVRSDVYLALGKVEDALADAMKASELNEESGQAYFRLGNAYALKGELDEAIDAYQKCLELEPDNLTMSNKVVENLDKLLSPPDPDSINIEERLLGIPDCPVSPLEQHSEEPEMSAEEAEIMASFNAQLLELESQMHNPDNLTMRDEIIARNLMDGSSSSSTSSLIRDMAPTSSHSDNSTGQDSSRPSPYPSCSSSIVDSVSCPNFSDQCSSSETSENDLNHSSSLVFNTERNAEREDFDPVLGSLSEIPEDLDPEVAALLGELYNATQETAEEARCKKRTLSQSQSCPSFRNEEAGPSKRFEQCNRTKKHGVFEDVISEEDFECKLCFEMMFNPVTTPCGHMFCRDCLFRTIDHSPHCPVCRLSLTPYVSLGKKDVTQIVNKMLELFFTDKHKVNEGKYKERMDRLARVGLDADVEVPIFVCLISFPTVQCSLHVFEPRYKRMVRECLESGSKKFGMCADDNTGTEYSDIGTIVEIKKIQTLPDGRFLIDTIALRRFLVKERLTKEGSLSARVSYFQDEDEDLPLERQQENERSSRTVYHTLYQYVNSLSQIEQDCIKNALGPMPGYQARAVRGQDGVAWVWWGLAALPLNIPAKLVVLRSKCPFDRIHSLNRFLRFMTRLHNRQTTGQMAPAEQQPAS